MSVLTDDFEAAKLVRRFCPVLSFFSNKAGQTCIPNCTAKGFQFFSFALGIQLYPAIG